MQPKLANLNLKIAKCKHLFQDLSFLISHIIFYIESTVDILKLLTFMFLHLSLKS